MVTQLVKNQPEVQETQVQPLGWEDPLEKEMAAHSSSLAWEIPWTEEPGGPQSVGSPESDPTEWLNQHHTTQLIYCVSLSAQQLIQLYVCIFSDTYTHNSLFSDSFLT